VEFHECLEDSRHWQAEGLLAIGQISYGLDLVLDFFWFFKSEHEMLKTFMKFLKKGSSREGVVALWTVLFE